MSSMSSSSVITINSTGVVIKRLWNSNTASNWTSLVDLLHHIILATDQIILIYTIDAVLIGDKASLSWVAVTALLHSTACLTIVKTTSHVYGACLIGDLVVGHVLKGVQVPSTMAALVFSLTRDQNLRRNIDIWPCSFPGDFDPIRES